ENQPRHIAFPEEVYVVRAGNNPNFDSDILRFHYQSLTTPESVYDFNMETNTRELKKRYTVKGYNPGDYQSERIFATAADGTQIPVSLVYKKGMIKNGQNPLYLYAYGSYGATIDPYFSSTRLSLLDRGYIYAIAHIRGSSFLGRQWYEAGKFLNKQNTFTDFISVAEH